MKAPLFRGHAECGEFADGVQDHLPMTEIDALRQTGGAAGVERRRLRVLVEIGKIEFRRRGRQHLLVVSGDFAFVDAQSPRCPTSE